MTDIFYIVTIAVLAMVALAKIDQKNFRLHQAEAREEHLERVLMLFGRHAPNCMELTPLDELARNPLACNCYLSRQ